MEIIQIQKSIETESKSDQFIEANTIGIHYEELKSRSIIPVFSKDNESTISHQEFMETTEQVIQDFLSGYKVKGPFIRVSHPVKGRIPEAVGKPVAELKEKDKTIYYERMAFLFDIPDIHDSVDNNKLSLSIGGVRAYNSENLSGKKTEERFKVFIGFKNLVCTNLCISTDGFRAEIKARSLHELYEQIFSLVSSYEAVSEINSLKQLMNYSINEQQFAQLVGRTRMYQYLPQKQKKAIEAFPLTDSQIGNITRQYYMDNSFCRLDNGNIDLWRLYNLFTGANKSSYIDSFLDRGMSSTRFVINIKDALDSGIKSWYLS